MELVIIACIPSTQNVLYKKAVGVGYVGKIELPEDV
jgi:hypothetical protein